MESWTYWISISSQAAIAKLLEDDPATNVYVQDAGLARTFALDWPWPARLAVLDFVNGFEASQGLVLFRGRELQWNEEVIREAFSLPSKRFSAWKLKWTGEAFTSMFTVRQIGSNPMSKTTLKLAFKQLEAPIRLIHNLLLGKNRPTQITGKQMWVYWSYWWPRISRENRATLPCPELKPDWARLVKDDLSMEIKSFRKHLAKEIHPGKRYAASLGTAITKFLLHHGYSKEELEQRWQDPETEENDDARENDQSQDDDGQKQEEQPAPTDHASSSQEAYVKSLESTVARMLRTQQDHAAQLQGHREEAALMNRIAEDYLMRIQNLRKENEVLLQANHGFREQITVLEQRNTLLQQQKDRKDREAKFLKGLNVKRMNYIDSLELKLSRREFLNYPALHYALFVS